MFCQHKEAFMIQLKTELIKVNAFRVLKLIFQYVKSFLQVKSYAKVQYKKQIKSKAELLLPQGWDQGYPPPVSPRQT